jgi:hypothetical protein
VSRTRVHWHARCLTCDWTAPGGVGPEHVRRVDIDAGKHSAKGGHPTVQEGTPT